MIRYLPKAPSPRYWITGNYLFDYRSSVNGMGALIQALLIGNEKSHLPQTVFLRLEDEGLGKYTGQIGVSLICFKTFFFFFF